MIRRALRYLAAVAAILVIAAAYLITSGWLTGHPVAGLPAPSPTASPSSNPTALIAIRDLPPTSTPTPTATSTPAISPTPAPVDYGPLEAALNRYVDEHVRARGFGVGIGFVDAQTGQTISLDGEARHYALSTFKGALAAYYLWQVERGLIELTAEDAAHIERMLEVSSNPDTTCVIKRVGGLAAFNDWLAYAGLSREQNFVMTWRSWPCEEDGESYTPEADLRYSVGDAALGLPGGNVLLRCSPLGLRCDKAFAPLELAGFYARLAQIGTVGVGGQSQVADGQRAVRVAHREPGGTVEPPRLPARGVGPLHRPGRPDGGRIRPLVER